MILCLLTLNKEKFGKLLNGEKIYVGRKPLLIGHNIFSGQIGLLGKQGQTVDIPNYDKKLKLDESITFVERFIMYRNSLYFSSFVMLYPIDEDDKSPEIEMIRMFKEHLIELIKN